MSDSKDLRERGCRFATIPGDGSLVMITHRLSWERIFKYENKRTKEDLVPGERFAIRINKDYFGTRWWCWGDQESDLKDKRLHAWRPPYDIEDKPDDEFLRKGNWVLGEEPMTFHWEIVNQDSAAMFEVVE